MSDNEILSVFEKLAADPVSDDIKSDEATRKRLYEAARTAMLKLESPWETVQRLSYLPQQLAVAQLGNQIKLWAHLTAQPSTTHALAASTGADASFLRRILRYAASQRMVEEVDEDSWRATNITASMAVPGNEQGIIHAAENCARPYLALPAYSQNAGYHDPSDSFHVPFQVGHGTKQNLFQWLGSGHGNFEAFNRYMRAQRLGAPVWLDKFRLEEYCDLDSKTERCEFVDVGGGQGHQCEGVVAKFPQLKGRVILQDLAPVLAKVLIPGVENKVQDFFQPQAVTGAKVYYLRMILHDWPNAQCEVILKNLVAGMSKDGVLLIDELVLPRTGAHWYVTQMDIAMMCMLSARERSLGEWEALLSASGLKMNKLVKYSEVGDSIIVAVPESRSV
ncbi:hypothetical protein FH972_023941 [Carpinus fangiana]|uniref:O-methyltransferase C-terminal domain-containing protein n=1 Tax=Carpinus fangiana TaxID=176857 RepID=A0A5N6KX42_9ROSI|nr:hypothetical protein FH972_023941 [Carpinus fangiana]